MTQDRTHRTTRGSTTTGDLSLLVAGEGVYATYPVPAQGRLMIGRGEDCDVVIDTPQVSRQHAILHTAGTIRLEDLGSTNGTRVHDRWLGARESIAVAPGDVIEIGAVILVLQRRLGAAKPIAAATAAIAEAGEPIVIDPAMRALYRVAERVAAGNIPVLILGETGSGKELVAERIERLSPRHGKPFLRLNCAALSEHLLESELFGHTRGAFTGAIQAKTGLLASASGGTVFLDELGELPLAIQAKLLRVLEDGHVRPVGALRPMPVDVRFIAATNRDLDAEVAAGRFREDLYFRVAAMPLVVPPLRERPSEIEPLAAAFLRRAAERSGRDVPALSEAARAVLAQHRFPGNVRELRLMMERAVLLCPGATIEPEHLSLPRLGGGSAPLAPAPALGASAAPGAAVGENADALRAGGDERARVIAALERCHGNQTRAARLLGMARSTLVKKIERYQLPRPRKD
jgi:transcriptional regulator with GAF, ATPase, and Fis domain